jgi:hypothetical protein
VDLADGYQTRYEQAQKATIAGAAFVATLLVALPPSGLIDLSRTQKSWMAGLFVLDLVFGLAIYYLFALLTHKGYMLLIKLSSSYDKPLSVIARMKDYTARKLLSYPQHKLLARCF